MRAERVQAEDRAAAQPGPGGDTPAALLEELRAHQVELQLQNEALRQSQLALEESRDRYVDFYDFAPVGYVTLTDQGLIAEVNLTGGEMLGMERARLLQRRFGSSVAQRDRDRWHRFFITALRCDSKFDCELALQRPDGSQIDLRLDGLRHAREGKAPVLRLVLSDITDRKRAQEQLLEMAASLEARVEQRTRQLRALSAELSMTEERERRLLAQDLHDDLGQLLAVTKIKLTSLAAGAEQSAIDQIVHLVDQAEQSARMITTQLSPPVLHTLGFVPALEWLADEMERIYGLSVQIDAECRQLRLGAEIQAMLHRSARELLINVARHAEIGEATLSCLCDGQRLLLVVSDDGCGFDPAGIAGVLAGHRNFGLGSICERVANLGGEVNIDSRPGNGTTVSLNLPILEKECPDDPDHSCR